MPSTRALANGLTLVGVLLLLTPQAMAGVSLGAQTIHYDVGYVTVTADGPELTGRVDDVPDADVLCWTSLSRACQLERALLNRPVEIDAGPTYYDRFTEYSYLLHEGTFYRTDATETELRLTPVNATRALERTSAPVDAPADVVAAFAAGRTEVATRATLPTHQLMALGDGRYATVREDYRSRSEVAKLLHGLEPLLGPLGFLLGLALVVGGQRRAVHEWYR
ncbi:MAG: hypothetical protein ABEJ68_06445 [Halobacteriaceae archaeon]